MFGRILGYAVRALLLLLFCGFAVLALVAVIMMWPIDYDGDHPDFAMLDKQLAELSPDSSALDLSGLNDGNWKTACLFGGYNDPSQDMAAFGIISRSDRTKLENKVSGYRLNEVEEHEFLIAFVKPDDTVEFIHFPGPSLQHLKHCADRKTPVVELPL